MEFRGIYNISNNEMSTYRAVRKIINGPTEVNCWSCCGPCHHKSDVDSLWKPCLKYHKDYGAVNSLIGEIQSNFSKVMKQHHRFLPLSPIPDKYSASFTVKSFFHIVDSQHKPLIIICTTNNRIILFRPVKNDESTRECWRMLHASQLNKSSVKIFYYHSTVNKNVFYLSGMGDSSNSSHNTADEECTIL